MNRKRRGCFWDEKDRPGRREYENLGSGSSITGRSWASPKVVIYPSEDLENYVCRSDFRMERLRWRAVARGTCRSSSIRPEAFQRENLPCVTMNLWEGRSAGGGAEYPTLPADFRNSGMSGVLRCVLLNGVWQNVSFTGPNCSESSKLR